MADRQLRQSIAAEAARLIQQRKETDYYSARRKAARWARRERVQAEDLPSYSEIQHELFALEGLFSRERQTSGLTEIRLAARDLLTVLADYDPLLSGPAVSGPVLPGADIEITLHAGDLSEVSAVLLEAGHHANLDRSGSLIFFHHYRCVIRWLLVQTGGLAKDSIEPDESWESDAQVGNPDADRSQGKVDLKGLDGLLYSDAARQRSYTTSDLSLEDIQQSEDEYHPEFFSILEVLLTKLEQVRQDPILHPEGDVLYHSLQVFERLRSERPYDEELLLAGLLHDAGLALDRRRPIEAIWQAIGELVTERTWYFIENRAEAVEYLRTGRIRGALKKSEDFEELVLLAKADLKGRVRGAEVSTLEEVLEYLSGLGSAWDDT